MSTVFQTALDRDELLAFALGRGRYFVHDRSGMSNGEHWVLGSWNSSIIPFERSDPAACSTGVRDMFDALVADAENAPDQHAWTILDHLHQFWRARRAGARLDLGATATPVARIVAAERSRCHLGDGQCDAETIELTIESVRRLGGLAELD